MQRYQKKGTMIVVEAVKLSVDNAAQVANWAQAQMVEEKDALSHEAFDALNVKTPEGRQRCSLGMYVIKHAGRFFVGHPSQFESLYEPMP
jgi:hypothetical protein